MSSPRPSRSGRATLASYARDIGAQAAEVRGQLAELKKIVRSSEADRADALLARAAATLYELSVAITLGRVGFVETGPAPEAALFPED